MLAELLNVSRQSISKWESDAGFPEVEKLLLLSNTLNVSLDYLMSIETVRNNSQESKKCVAGTTIITSPYEDVLATCYKVQSSGKMKGGKDSPQYALFAVSDEASFWGQPTTFFGWYADHEHISEEMKESRQAIAEGVSMYELKFSVKVERHGLKMKIVSDRS